MDSPLNAEQECCLCQDACNSVNDLKNHLQIVHNLKKSETDVYVNLSVEEKLKRKEEMGENGLEREDEGFFKKSDHEEEISEEFKSFLEAEVKSSFNLLFKDLFDVLDGKAIPDIPEGDMEEDFSIADIQDAFDNLGEAFENMEIPDSVMISLREEFEAQKTDNGKHVEVSSVVENPEEAKRKPREQERSLNVEKPTVKEEAKKKKREKTSNFKVPEKLAGEAGLAPVQSDRSSRSGSLGSSTGKPVSIYSCPYAPSCSFQLTKKEMRDAAKVCNHLKNQHQVTEEDMALAVKEKNKKFNFTK